MTTYLIKMLLGGSVCGIGALIVCLIKKYQARKLIYIVVLSVYAGAILTLTLWRSVTPGMERHFNLIPFREIISNLRREIYYHALTMLVNIGMFIPFGVLLKIGKLNIKKTLLICFLSSLGIELIQVILNTGSFDIDDIILNVIGTLAGFFLTALFMHIKQHKG